MKQRSWKIVRRAYTIVELVIVVAILGIAGMLLVPNLIDRDTFAIQAAVRTVISDIVFAQVGCARQPGVPARSIPRVTDRPGRLRRILSRESDTLLVQLSIRQRDGRLCR